MVVHSIGRARDCRVQGWDARCRVQGAGCRVQGPGSRGKVRGAGVGAGAGCRVQGQGLGDLWEEVTPPGGREGVEHCWCTAAGYGV